MSKSKYVPHENSASIEELNNIKSVLLSNKNRNVLEQKKLEAVTHQIENYNMYQKSIDSDK